MAGDYNLLAGLDATKDLNVRLVVESYIHSSQESLISFDYEQGGLSRMAEDGFLGHQHCVVVLGQNIGLTGHTRFQVGDWLRRCQLDQECVGLFVSAGGDSVDLQRDVMAGQGRTGEANRLPYPEGADASPVWPR